MEEPGEHDAQPSNAADLARWPAVGLLFVGIASFLYEVSRLIWGEEISRWIIQIAQKIYPEIDLSTLSFADPPNLIASILGLGLTVIVIAGGTAMLNLRLWALTLLAAILAMVPCFGPCCGLFFPIGLWSIFILMKPQVRAAMHRG